MPIERPPHPRFDHGQPIHRPQTLPILFFLVALTGGLAAFNARSIHALYVDLPLPHPSGHIGALSPQNNLLAIDAKGGLRWNAQPVSRSDLRIILDHVKTLDPQPPLQFAPDADASFADALAVMEVVHEAGLIDSCFRFAGITRYRRYEAPPDPEELLPGEMRECDFAGY